MVHRLIERLENARPVRDLDADIAIALGIVAERKWWSIDYLSSNVIGCYTSSIDAAIGLCETVLPGWHWTTSNKNRRWNDKGDWRPWASISSHAFNEESDPSAINDYYDAFAVCVPVALCLCVLKAKQDQEARA